MKEKHQLHIFLRLLAFILFISTFLNALSCLFTRNFKRVEQLQQWRYFTLTGLISFFIIALIAGFFPEMQSLCMVYVWFGLFILAEFTERLWQPSSYITD